MNEVMAVQKQIMWQGLQVADDQVEKVFALARKEGWTDVEEFCRGNLIPQAIEQQGWILKPVEQYTGIIPSEAKDRAHQIVNSGIEVVGWVIGEDKRILERDIAQPNVVSSLEQPAVSQTIINSIKAGGALIAGLLASVGVAALVTAVVAVAVAALVVAALVAALAASIAAPVAVMGAAAAIVTYDPVLVCVVQNSEGDVIWIKVYQWWD